MYCGHGILLRYLCKHRKCGGECTAPFVCDFAENADGQNIKELDRKRKWRQAHGYRST